MKANILMPLRFNYFCDIQKLVFIFLILFTVSCKPNTKQNNSEEEIMELNDPQDSMITTSEINIDSVPLKQVDSLPAKENIEDLKQTAKPVVVKISSIHFEDPIYQFSRMTEGDTLHHTFYFENKGNAPLMIRDVSVDCGCTVPEYSTDEIPPGEKGSINVTFDSKGKIGMQERVITILTNGKPMSTTVRLKGIVDTD